MLKDDLLNALIGDVYVSDAQEREQKLMPVLDQAISDACAEIDGYLARRYAVPLADAPAVINKYAKDIAVYNLVSRIGVGADADRENNYIERYRFALKFFEALAKGTVTLGFEAPSRQAATGFQMSGPARIFGRDRMQGM